MLSHRRPRHAQAPAERAGRRRGAEQVSLAVSALEGTATRSVRRCRQSSCAPPLTRIFREATRASTLRHYVLVFDHGTGRLLACQELSDAESATTRYSQREDERFHGTLAASRFGVESQQRGSTPVGVAPMPLQ